MQVEVEAADQRAAIGAGRGARLESASFAQMKESRGVEGLYELRVESWGIGGSESGWKDR